MVRELAAATALIRPVRIPVPVHDAVHDGTDVYGDWKLTAVQAPAAIVQVPARSLFAAPLVIWSPTAVSLNPKKLDGTEEELVITFPLGPITYIAIWASLAVVIVFELT
jgi:hypothetical protein